MMKRFITLFLASVMLFSCFSLFVSAENNGVVKAERISAKPGEEISVPVSFVDHNGIYIIRVTLKYDTRALEYNGIDKSAEKTFNYTVNSENEGELIVLMDGKSMENVTGDLELFIVKFKVKKDAPAGRVLIPLYCEEGMATRIEGSGSNITPVGFAPATSTGSVTILCDEHTFDLEMSDGTVQCSNCGAVKNAKGEVSVDPDAGLPEIDVSSDPSVSETVDTPSEDKQLNSADGSDGEGLSAKHFIPIIAAVVVAVLIPLVIVIMKRKKSSSAEQDED